MCAGAVGILEESGVLWAPGGPRQTRRILACFPITADVGGFELQEGVPLDIEGEIWRFVGRGRRHAHIDSDELIMSAGVEGNRTEGDEVKDEGVPQCREGESGNEPDCIDRIDSVEGEQL